MRSRADYEEALAYLKCVVLGLEKQLQMGGFAPSPATTVGPTPAAPEKVPVTTTGSRPGSKPAGKGAAQAAAKPVPDQLPQLYGQLNQTGALAVGTMANLTRAAALGGSSTPNTGL